jgi:hypothetical protein
MSLNLRAAQQEEFAASQAVDAFGRNRVTPALGIRSRPAANVTHLRADRRLEIGVELTMRPPRI